MKTNYKSKYDSLKKEHSYMVRAYQNEIKANRLNRSKRNRLYAVIRLALNRANQILEE